MNLTIMLFNSFRYTSVDVYCSIIHDNNVSRSKKDVAMRHKLINDSIVKVLDIELIFLDVDA